jgi:hypothetical protein
MEHNKQLAENAGRAERIIDDSDRLIREIRAGISGGDSK